MAEIRAKGVSLGVARRRLETRLHGTGLANKWLKAKEKAPFSVESEKITQREGGDKEEKLGKDGKERKGEVPDSCWSDDMNKKVKPNLLPFQHHDPTLEFTTWMTLPIASDQTCFKCYTRLSLTLLRGRIKAPCVVVYGDSKVGWWRGMIDIFMASFPHLFVSIY